MGALAVCVLEPSAHAQPKGPRPAPLPPRALERFQKMTPEQRQRALERLPPDRRARIEEQLRRLQNLPPDQRQQLQERYQRFQSLPRDRQIAVRTELQSLRQMPPAERRARVNSPEFQETYSPQEQRLLRESLGMRVQP